MGLVVIFALPNRPRNARWLSSAEKVWIQSRLDEETLQSREKAHSRLSEAFMSGRIWLLCFIYFLLTVGIYGYEMWLPSIIKEFSGLSYSVVGLINAIPYLMAVAAFSAAVGFGFSAWL